ncbi:MAG: hypothetical protein WCO69_02345 [Candidatus Omnitrophota bacterium]
MSYHTFVTVGVCIALAAALGSAFMKFTSHQFVNNPAESAYHGTSTREEASEKAENTAERQRRMMDDLKSRMERLKR